MNNPIAQVYYYVLVRNNIIGIPTTLGCMEPRHSENLFGGNVLLLSIIVERVGMGRTKCFYCSLSNSTFNRFYVYKPEASLWVLGLLNWLQHLSPLARGRPGARGR